MEQTRPLSYVEALAFLLLVALSLPGCATTEYAKIQAYGLHAITPYGMLSLGVLDYTRAARPEPTVEATQKPRQDGSF